MTAAPHTVSGRIIAPFITPRTLPKASARPAQAPSPATSGFGLLLSAFALSCGRIKLDGTAKIPGPYDASAATDTGTDDVDEVTEGADTDDTVEVAAATPDPALPAAIAFGDETIVTPPCAQDEYLTDLDITQNGRNLVGVCTHPQGKSTTIFQYHPDDPANSMTVLLQAQSPKSPLARTVLLAPYNDAEWFTSARLFGKGDSTAAGFLQLTAGTKNPVVAISLPWIADTTGQYYLDTSYLQDGALPADLPANTTVSRSQNVNGIAATAETLFLAAGNPIERCWTDFAQTICEPADQAGMLYLVGLVKKEGAQPTDYFHALPIKHHGPQSVGLVDAPAGASLAVLIASGASSQYPAPDDALTEGGLYVVDAATLDFAYLQADGTAQAVVLPHGAGQFGEVGRRPYLGSLEDAALDARVVFGDAKGHGYLVDVTVAPDPANTPGTAPGFSQYPVATADHAISGAFLTYDGQYAVFYDATNQQLTAARTTGAAFAEPLLPPAATKTLAALQGDDSAVPGLEHFKSAAGPAWAVAHNGHTIVQVPIHEAP